MWIYYNNGLSNYYSLSDTSEPNEFAFEEHPTDEELVSVFPDYLIKKEEARLESLSILRGAAYKDEADPIFFQWQRGEKTEQEWLDKVAEIKQRYN